MESTPVEKENAVFIIIALIIGGAIFGFVSGFFGNWVMLYYGFPSIRNLIRAYGIPVTIYLIVAGVMIFVKDEEKRKGARYISFTVGTMIGFILGLSLMNSIS